MAIQIAGNQIKTGAVDTNQIAAGAIEPAKLDLTANFTFTGNVAGITPTANGHFTTKQYVDGIVGNGVFWKEPCEVATTANVNLSNPGTDTFDGVQISSGSRVLVRAQSTSAQNGLYLFNGSSSAMTRTSDADEAQELQNAAVFVNSGNTFSDQAFVETETIATLGTSNVEFVRFSGLGMVEAGDALSKTGDQLNVVADDSTIEIVSDALQLKDAGITNAKIGDLEISAGKLAGSIPDSKLQNISTAGKVLGSAVQLNGSGGLENSSGLKISDLAVTDGMLAGSISASKLAGSIPDSKLLQISSADKVAGSAIQLSGGSLEDSTGLKVANGGISNAMLAGSISDSKMLQITSANKVAGSAIQLNGTSLEDSSGLRIKAGGVNNDMLADETIQSGKLNFEPTRETLSTNGNTTAFVLSNSVPDGFDDVLVFRNGLLAERVANSPADEDQYTSSLSSNTCTITFGSAPAGTDKVIVCYFNIK